MTPWSELSMRQMMSFRWRVLSDLMTSFKVIYKTTTLFIVETLI